MCAACSNEGGTPGLIVEGYALDADAVLEWDTLLEIRSPLEDTTLIAPYQVLGWNDGVVVADALANRLTFFDLDGSVLWTAGRRGEGPQEFRAINDLFSDSDSTLWVLDASNMRIARVSPTGEIFDPTPLADIPPFPWGLLNLGDSLLVLGMHPERTLSMLSRADLKITSTRGFYWPDGIPDRGPVSLRGTHSPDLKSWAAGLQLGPGFLINHEGHESTHYFAEPVPWATDGPQARAVFGTTAASATNESIYFLFGGRPKRVEDMSGDPPRRIDQYDWEGQFLRRYLLPGGVTDFHTDGDRFLVIEEEPIPAVLVLRPRRSTQ